MQLYFLGPFQNNAWKKIGCMNIMDCELLDIRNLFFYDIPEFMECQQIMHCPIFISICIKNLRQTFRIVASCFFKIHILIDREASISQYRDTILPVFIGFSQLAHAMNVFYLFYICFVKLLIIDTTPVHID